MLKLIAAHEADINSVKEYAGSFVEKNLEWMFRELLKNGEEEYRRIQREYYKNTYFLVDDTAEYYIIGHGNIEDGYDFHRSYMNFGNISYTIKPDMRRRQYGTELLRLLLKLCRAKGMREVCVSCLEENIASKLIIEKNGGKLEKRFIDEDDFGGTGKPALKYWIKMPRRSLAERFFKRYA